MVMSLDSSDLNYNTGGKFCAVKFSPTILKKGTVERLKEKSKEIHAFVQQQSSATTHEIQSLIEPEDSDLRENSSYENKEKKAKRLANYILSEIVKLFVENEISNNVQKVSDHTNQTKVSFKSAKPDSVKLDEISINVHQNKDTKAISHEGRLYKHENIVNVLIQTMDIVNGVPMRIIGM